MVRQPTPDVFKQKVHQSLMKNYHVTVPNNCPVPPIVLFFRYLLKSILRVQNSDPSCTPMWRKRTMHPEKIHFPLPTLGTVQEWECFFLLLSIHTLKEGVYGRKKNKKSTKNLTPALGQE